MIMHISCFLIWSQEYQEASVPYEQDPNVAYQDPNLAYVDPAAMQYADPNDPYHNANMPYVDPNAAYMDPNQAYVTDPNAPPPGQGYHQDPNMPPYQDPNYPQYYATDPAYQQAPPGECCHRFQSHVCYNRGYFFLANIVMWLI